MSITAIVGLGNPGDEYRGTLHNIGFEVIDAFAQTTGATWSKASKFDAHWAKATFADRTIHLLKPQTYMNESGRSVTKFIRFHRLQAPSIVVIYDDITIEPARVKLSEHGSSGGHNGLESLFQHVGNTFIRYRVGVGGKRHPQMDLKDHVLSRFNESERKLIDSRLPDYANDLHLILREGVERAMNQINQRSRYYEPSPHHE